MKGRSKDRKKERKKRCAGITSWYFNESLTRQHGQAINLTLDLNSGQGDPRSIRIDDQWNKAGWNVGRHVLDKVHVSHLRATSPLPLNSQKPERNKSIPTEEQLIAALNCSVPLGLSDWSRGSHVPTLPLTNEPMIVFQPLSLIYVNEMNGTGKAQVEEAYNQRCSSWQLMTTNDGDPPSYPRTIYISGNPLNFFFFFSFVILVRCPLDPPPPPLPLPQIQLMNITNKTNSTFHSPSGRNWLAPIRPRFEPVASSSTSWKNRGGAKKQKSKNKSTSRSIESHMRV